MKLLLLKCIPLALTHSLPALPWVIIQSFSSILTDAHRRFQYEHSRNSNGSSVFNSIFCRRGTPSLTSRFCVADLLREDKPGQKNVGLRWNGCDRTACDFARHQTLFFSPRWSSMTYCSCMFLQESMSDADAALCFAANTNNQTGNSKNNSSFATMFLQCYKILRPRALYTLTLFHPTLRCGPTSSMQEAAKALWPPTREGEPLVGLKTFQPAGSLSEKRKRTPTPQN